MVLPGTHRCFLIQFMNNGHSLILFCKQLYFFILAGKAEYSFLLSGLIWYLLAFLSKTKHALVHSYHYRYFLIFLVQMVFFCSFWDNKLLFVLSGTHANLLKIVNRPGVPGLFYKQLRH